MSGYGYDISILNSVPVATQSQLQPKAEYSTDPTMSSLQRQSLDGVEPTTPAVPFQSRPFYRTKRGLIIIIIGFFALLAVIVGAVFGSKNKKKSSEKRPTSTSAGATGVQTLSSAKPTYLTSRTFTWTITRSGAPIPTTSVFPPGIGLVVAT